MANLPRRYPGRNRPLVGPGYLMIEIRGIAATRDKFD